MAICVTPTESSLLLAVNPQVAVLDFHRADEDDMVGAGLLRAAVIDAVHSGAVAGVCDAVVPHAGDIPAFGCIFLKDRIVG